MSIFKNDNGIYLGITVHDPSFSDQATSQLNAPWNPNNRTFNYTGDGHLVLIGPNGSGKTRNALLPNLFGTPNWSKLVVDPKAELAIWTAKHLKDANSEIQVCDPFGVIERNYPGLVKKLPYLKNRLFNPITMLDPDSESFADDAKLIAEALIKIDEKDTHWGQSARELITGLIMALRMTNKQDDSPNSLVEVRHVLGMAPDAFANYIEGLVRDTKSEPAIAAKLNRFTNFSSENRELLSVLSTAITQTDWLDSKPIQCALRDGTIDFSEMKKRPMTIFLILPPHYLESHSIWLRLMITAVLTPLIRSKTKDQDVPVLFMLDEFAQLGRLEIIERNMPIMRGYGIKLWTILQDLSQLKNCYKNRWESFIANAGIIQSFAPNDMTTREYLANLSGNRLYWICTNSQSRSTSSNSNWECESICHSYQYSWTYYLGKIHPEDDLARMKQTQTVLYEYQCPPRRILLPDPSTMSSYYPIQPSEPRQQLSISEILRQADKFASQWGRDSEW